MLNSRPPETMPRLTVTGRQKRVDGVATERGIRAVSGAPAGFEPEPQHTLVGIHDLQIGGFERDGEVGFESGLRERLRAGAASFLAHGRGDHPAGA